MLCRYNYIFIFISHSQNYLFHPLSRAILHIIRTMMFHNDYGIHNAPIKTCDLSKAHVRDWAGCIKQLMKIT